MKLSEFNDAMVNHIQDLMIQLKNDKISIEEYKIKLSRYKHNKKTQRAIIKKRG